MGITAKGARPGRSHRHRSPKGRGNHSLQRKGLIAALFTSTQERVLGLLFGQQNRSFFITELIQLAKSGRGAVQRELQRLTAAGLVIETRQGSQKHFQANQAAPIFAELRGIIIKTVGLTEPIRHALSCLKQEPELALVYGSVAKHSDTASSDIDLLVVSDALCLEDLYVALAAAEESLSRKINVILLTTEEFNRRRIDKSPFISRVLAGDYLLLAGEIDAIEAAP